MKDGFRINGARVFDGERMLGAADVFIRGGRIVAVVDPSEATDELESIDGRGKTLLPGLIDAHVHSNGLARRDALRFGVTTELDMFSDWRQLVDAKRRRASLDATDQADLWSAGTAATVDGGHCTQFGLIIPTLSSSSSAADWVASRVAEGSDYIKIILEDRSLYGGPLLPTLQAETAAALVEAAHCHARLAVVHVSMEHFAMQALAADADGLMHMFHDKVAETAFVSLARRRKTFVVATLTLIAGIAGESDGVHDDPRLSPWLSRAQRQTLTGRPSRREPRRHFIANARESVRRLYDAGVTVLAGTDAPNRNTANGISMHEELAQLVKAGLSTQDALGAATSRPADVFGLADRGRIAVGKRADLLLVDGDPTIDVYATRAIAAIWKNGQLVDRTPRRASMAAPSCGECCA